MKSRRLGRGTTLALDKAKRDLGQDGVDEVLVQSRGIRTFCEIDRLVLGLFGLAQSPC